MPELPEVETMVRGIRPALVGRKILSVQLLKTPYRPITLVPAIRSLASRASNQLITAVTRRAKRALISLESGDTFVIEPRMTGLLLLADPPDLEHLRFHWQLDSSNLWFWDRRGLGTIRLLSPDKLAVALGPRTLGPEPLDLTPNQWTEICRKTARPIKVALLDQKLVAGIGNLYASEILHLARISPLQPASSLRPPQIARLASATAEVLHTAIKYEGSTLADGTYRNSLNLPGSYQNAHRVYDRAGEICLTCTLGKITRVVQAQRSTFYCPRCQKPPRH